MRWLPHPYMPVDVMTKADLSKSNAAQFQLLRTGLPKITAESDHLEKRHQDPTAKGRSHAASLKLLSKPSEEPTAGLITFCRSPN